MKYLNLLKNRILQTILVLGLFIIFSNKLPLWVLRAFFTCSILIKDILIFILPIMVCAFIAASLSKFQKQAPLFIFILIAFEACSNFISVWYAYFTGLEICTLVNNVNIMQQEIVGLKSYFYLSELCPKWWSASKGIIAGLILGLLCAQFNFYKLRNCIMTSKNTIEFILTKIFARLIPIFILGFIANAYAMNTLEKIFMEFIGVIFWILMAVLAYLLFLYLVAARFNIIKATKNIINILPAWFVALSSGCSISTMPFTIKGTAKSLQNPDFANMVIPATTNIQQIGDCIIQALLCLVIIKNFGHTLPSAYQWLEFSLVFTLARFTTAAVLGGAIFIMLPIYASYLGFSGEMIAVILAFNVILDPIVTSSNVMANAASCNILETIWLRISKTYKNQVLEYIQEN